MLVQSGVRDSLANVLHLLLYIAHDLPYRRDINALSADVLDLCR